MLTAFRQAVIDLLTTGLPDAAIYPTVPDDLNEVPCVIVDLPGASETATPVVFDLTVDLLVVGRRVQAGDADDELTQLADQVWTVLRGTRAVRHAAYSLAATTLTPRTVTVAGVELPAYTITVDAPLATC